MPKKLYVLAAIFLLLAAGVVFARIEHNRRYQAKTGGFFDGMIYSSSIEKTGPGGDFVLKIQDGYWRLVQPFSFNADGRVCESFLYLLESLSFSGALNSGGETLDVFGFPDNVQPVNYVIKGVYGQTIADFSAGKRADDNSGMYFLFNSSKEVRKAEWLTSIPQTADFFMDRLICDITYSNIVSLKFEKNGKTRELKSIPSEKEQAVYKTFADSLSGNYAVKIIHENGALIDFKTSWSLTVETAGGEKTLLRFGKYNGEWVLKKNNEGRVLYAPAPSFFKEAQSLTDGL